MQPNFPRHITVNYTEPDVVELDGIRLVLNKKPAFVFQKHFLNNNLKRIKPLNIYSMAD
jgi:hypothetical protein